MSYLSSHMNKRFSTALALLLVSVGLKRSPLDLMTFEKREQFTFSSPLSMMRFSPNGKQLFVLAANQTVYLLDVSAYAGPKATQSN